MNICIYIYIFYNHIYIYMYTYTIYNRLTFPESRVGKRPYVAPGKGWNP